MEPASLGFVTQISLSVGRNVAHAGKNAESFNPRRNGVLGLYRDIEAFAIATHLKHRVVIVHTIQEAVYDVFW